LGKRDRYERGNGDLELGKVGLDGGKLILDGKIGGKYSLTDIPGQFFPDEIFVNDNPKRIF
jgi:hypothetical protein